MEQREIEKEIGELEDRVDRLRVLYEQYFLGFEKLEPTVPRKDVERRFAILRKENIRNTAIRYRFNVVNQKYNTYGMHWTRICRQIEEGTFKRHLKKAQERFGDVASMQAAKKTEREAAETSFDVDMDDFDSVDVDSVLDEANRAAAKFERPPVDTVPPGPASSPMRASPSSPIDRVARHAALPAAGSKPKLIRKVVKAPGAAPSGAHDVSQSAPPDSAPTPPPMQRPAPSPSGSIRGPMPSAPSAGRIAVPANAAPSGRIPIGAPPPHSERRLPIPAPPPSDRRLPVPPVGGVRPMIRPAIRPATQSQPDLGNAHDRPSQPKVPVPAPASRPRAPLPLPSQIDRDEKK